MFNHVAPYRYLLPTVYLFVADIANPDLFVCCCRTWICLDIARFYEEQCQPSSVSTWLACQLSPPQTVNRAPITWDGGFDTIYTAVCHNCCDSSTTRRLCPLEPGTHGHNTEDLYINGLLFPFSHSIRPQKQQH